MWKNAPFLAIVAVDTAENEPSKNLQICKNPADEEELRDAELVPGRGKPERRRAEGPRVHVEAAGLGLKGSIGDRSNHSNFSHQNSVKILSEFRKIHQKFSENFWNLRNSQHFLKYSAKFREIFVRIGAKFDEKVLKTSDFTEI